MVAYPFPKSFPPRLEPSGNFETVEWAAPFRASKGMPIKKKLPRAEVKLGNFIAGKR